MTTSCLYTSTQSSTCQTQKAEFAQRGLIPNLPCPDGLLLSRQNSQTQLSFVFLFWLQLRGISVCLLYHFPQLLNLQFTWSYLLQAKMELKWPPVPSLNRFNAKAVGAFPGTQSGKHISQHISNVFWHNLHEAIY